MAQPNPRLIQVGTLSLDPRRISQVEDGFTTRPLSPGRAGVARIPQVTVSQRGSEAVTFHGEEARHFLDQWELWLRGDAAFHRVA